MCDCLDIEVNKHDREYCCKCGRKMVKETEEYEVWGHREVVVNYYCPCCGNCE